MLTPSFAEMFQPDACPRGVVHIRFLEVNIFSQHLKSHMYENDRRSEILSPTTRLYDIIIIVKGSQFSVYLC